MSNAMAEISEARGLANVLVAQEFRRTKDRPQARIHVARALGTTPGTIENLQRGRLKKIAGWLRDALRARVTRALESEIARLQHELSIHQSAGVDPHSHEATAVRADLSAILEVLGRPRR